MFIDKLARIVIAILVLYFFLFIFGFFKEDRAPRKKTPICDVSYVDIVNFRADFKIEPPNDYVMRGAATIFNRCPNPVNLKMKLSSYDKNGAIVSVSDFWPASIDKIPNGEYSFSLDHHLKFDERISSFKLSVISID
ncbi:hypothetical protein L0Y26_10505 [Pectobacterium aroidearum]|uniref:hypothetical protein n=1 Tax=Pectobacterium aroidearum TaxID=1201031 RepID=UPI002115050D|nr:hypothetical protein [Pectobacterium aroidearum]UUE38313.1 hypothetical protein L0Y26_10505 [Pectobacterium aroidearum]UUE42688.1 hypothetical protein L0Y25_10510 [Pectobacterium aroidearum]